MSSSSKVTIRIEIDVPRGSTVHPSVHHKDESFTITSSTDPTVSLSNPVFTISGGMINVSCIFMVTGLVSPTISAIVTVAATSPPTAAPGVTLTGSTVSFSVPFNSPLVGNSVVLSVFAVAGSDIAGDSATINIPTPSPMPFCDPLA